MTNFNNLIQKIRDDSITSRANFAKLEALAKEFNIPIHAVLSIVESELNKEAFANINSDEGWVIDGSAPATTPQKEPIKQGAPPAQAPPQQPRSAPKVKPIVEIQPSVEEAPPTSSKPKPQKPQNTPHRTVHSHYKTSNKSACHLQ